jgi:hypothetical protein
MVRGVQKPLEWTGLRVLAWTGLARPALDWTGGLWAGLA